MISRLLEEFDGELNKLGVKYSLTKEDQEFIIDSFFKDLKLMLSDVRVPKVMIPYIGIFKPSHSKMKASFNRFLSWRRKIGKKDFNSDNFKERLRTYWKVYKRLQLEKSLKGVITYKEWHQGKYPTEEK